MTTPTNEQMALALAALQAGIEVAVDSAKVYVADAGDCGGQHVGRTPIEALSTAAVFLRLQPIYCPPPQQGDMVMVPRDLLRHLVGCAEELVEQEARMGNDSPATDTAISLANTLLGGG